MRASAKCPLLIATVLALANCGGGSDLTSIPSPPPTSTPPTSSPIIPAATTNQEFAVAGSVNTDAAGQPPLLNASEQMQVRYVAGSGLYEVQIPGEEWAKVSIDSSKYANFPAGCGCGTNLLIIGSGYQYSRLLYWFDGASFGNEAIGIATEAGGVPTTGSASYAGTIQGTTTEPHWDGLGSAVDGSITLLFDFGAGELSGKISPNLHQGFDFDALSFRDTVYSTGSTTFSGKFDTNVTGTNSFGGLFTGPHAEELIGNWAFPYQSPIDGGTYQANGALIGKK